MRQRAETLVLQIFRGLFYCMLALLSKSLAPKQRPSKAFESLRQFLCRCNPSVTPEKTSQDSKLYNLMAQAMIDKMGISCQGPELLWARFSLVCFISQDI